MTRWEASQRAINWRWRWLVNIALAGTYPFEPLATWRGCLLAAAGAILRAEVRRASLWITAVENLYIVARRIRSAGRRRP